MTHQSEFERLISALQPWLTNVVIIGGWAHRLHQAHPLAQSLGHDPVYTRDADVAFDTQARLEGQIADALHTAGFIETLSSDETPPVAQYQLGVEDQGFYAEFLTPLTGSGIRRDGSADATIERAGIIAPKTATSGGATRRTLALPSWRRRTVCAHHAGRGSGCESGELRCAEVADPRQPAAIKARPRHPVHS